MKNGTDEEFSALLENFLNLNRTTFTQEIHTEHTIKTLDIQPVKGKVIAVEKTDKPFLFTGENHSLTPAPPIENAQKNLRACGIGEFIGVICSSFAAGDWENYHPYPQVWFTDEEAAEACIRRGYQITTERVRKYLGQILERGHKLIETRENIMIGRREYRRANLIHESAKEYFRVEAPSLHAEEKPSQEYRTRYNRSAAKN